MEQPTPTQPPVQPPSQQPPSQVPPQPMKKSTKIGAIIALVFLVGITLFAIIAGVTQSIANAGVLDINVTGFKNGEGRRTDRGLSADSKIVGSDREFTFEGNVQNGGDDLKVTIGGQEATLNGEDYTLTVPLEPGRNEFEIVATSGDKTNSRTITLTTMYTDL